MASDLRVVELDFDNIKDNLKNFLRGQEYFTDYDFEGSALSILMDMLAYDTHYKAYLANMVINERFIDTSVKRASVISHAKTLGYVPRSASAATAVVDITVFGVSEDYTMTLDKYTPFSSKIDNATYTFVNNETYTATPSGEFNTYTFKGVKLYEGTPIEYTYTVPAGGDRQLFKIPALNVDTSTLNVVVQQSATDTSVKHYTYSENISQITNDHLVYFLEEGVDGYFYVYFGDNVIGKAIEPGNIIRLSYLVTNGPAANTSSIYSQIFTLETNIAGYFASNVIIEVKSPSNGGANKQETESIRFLAPKVYTANGRAITSDDYAALLTKNFPAIDSVVVWGGEENNPPSFGNVLLAIKPTNGYILDYPTQEAIRKFLLEKSMINVNFQFIEPDFTFITVTNNVKFDPTLTNKTATEISALATNAIKTFFEYNLQQFGRKLYISKLQTAIDLQDDSILGNTITLNLQKRIEPVFSLNSSYTLYFNNSITPYSLYSSAFNVINANSVYTVIIKDTPDTNPPTSAKTGTLSLVNINDNTVIIKNVGKVNYSTGVVTITDLNISGYPSVYIGDIRVNCEPKDIVDEISNSATGSTVPLAVRNQILMLDDSVLVPGYYVNSGLYVTATAV